MSDDDLEIFEDAVGDGPATRKQTEVRGEHAWEMADRTLRVAFEHCCKGGEEPQ
jgi:hypothetical protein